MPAFFSVPDYFDFLVESASDLPPLLTFLSMAYFSPIKNKLLTYVKLVAASDLESLFLVDTSLLPSSLLLLLILPVLDFLFDR